MMQDQKITSITIPEDLMESLNRAAAHTGRPETSILREAIEAYMRSFERPVFRSLGIGRDTEVSSTNVKDWLKQNDRQ